jgi:hypothetical protein
MGVALEPVRGSAEATDPWPCPVCAEERAAEREHVAAAAAAPPVAPPPLCASHAATLVDVAGPGLEEWATALLAREAERLASAAGEPPRQRRGRGTPCVACEAGARAAETALRRLLADLGTPGARRAHGLGPALCRQHLRLAAALGPRRTAGALRLAGEARTRLSALAAQLDRYQELQEYRNRHVPKGEEQQAWKRALAFFWPPAPPRVVPPPPRRDPPPTPAWAEGDTVSMHCVRMLAQGGCPACREARHAAAVEVRWLLLENYNSEPTILALVRGGYCPAHARLLLDMDARQLCVTLLALTRIEIALLGRRAPARQPRRPGLCPACQSAATAAAVAIDDLRQSWRRPQARRFYEQADGLCRVHAEQALGGLRAADAAWLRAAAAGQFRRAVQGGRGDHPALLWSAPPWPGPDEVEPRSARQWDAPIGSRVQPVPGPE